MPDFGRWTSNGGDPSLNEINRVDRFFDALGAKETAYSTDRAEAELSFLLADWRDDVRSAPSTVPVTMRDAVAALDGGRTGRKRNKTSLALVGSVAAAVLAIGGFGTAVYSAGPGDAFYGIRSTLFGQQQVRDDRVALASAELQQVQQLIDDGQWEQAQEKLVALTPTVQGVEAPEQRQELVDQYNQLTYKVVEQNPAATLPPPGEPMPVLPQSPLTLLPPVPDVSATLPSTPTSSETSTETSTETSSPTSSSETTTTPSTPGPEVLSTPPTSPTDPTPLPTPSAPLPTPSAPLPTPSTPQPTPSALLPTPTTTTTTVADVTSVTPAPQAPPAASAPSSAPAPASEPASETPSRQPRIAPSSTAAQQPSDSEGSAPTVAPTQAVVPTRAPQGSGSADQGGPTTTIMPPG